MTPQSDDTVRALVQRMLAALTAGEEPYSTNELSSAVFTLNRLVIQTLLQAHNTAELRTGLLKSVGALEAEVYKHEPHQTTETMN